MKTVQVKPDHAAIADYYKTLDTLQRGQRVTHEGAVRRAFGALLETTARARGWTLVEELGRQSTRTSRTVYPDGTLRDEWQLHPARH